jgi:alpha-methylacyl-CoA racemase
MSDAEEVTSRGPLAGLRVVDMSRLAPGPYCTMLLADLGADVITVGGGRAAMPVRELSRGKRRITLNLKSPAGKAALHALVKKADVFVEGFRPGVAARLGADYEELSALNPGLVYCALTGYGQDGPRAKEAGHDIDYLALTGVLGAIGPGDRRPYPPLNLLADFAGGGLIATVGILAALLEAHSSGKGQYIDAAMIDGALSLMAMHFPTWDTPVLPGRGSGLLAGDKPFYRTYACSDGKFVSVGALEPAFFQALWRKLGLGEVPDHMRVSNWPGIESKLAAAFSTRTRDAWAAEFAGTDACVAPVLDPDEVWSEPHIAARHHGARPSNVPAVPRFGRTPAEARPLDLCDRTAEVLHEIGLSEAEVEAATADEAGAGPGAAWPPVLSP